MSYYAVRLHVPATAYYIRQEGSQSLIEYLEERFDTVIVYEHYGDANDTGRVHTHMLLAHPTESVTADTIKKSAPFKYLKLKGSEQLSFKTKFKDKKTKQVYPMDADNVARYIIYMSKGQYDPDILSTKSIYDWDSCKELRSRWVAAPIGKDIQTYKNFDAWLNTQPACPQPTREEINPEYPWLKRKVWEFTMALHTVFNQKAASDFRMLLVTAQFRRGINSTEKSKAYI